MTFICGLKDTGQSKANRQAGWRPFILGSSPFVCPTDIGQAGQIMSDLPGMVYDDVGKGYRDVWLEGNPGGIHRQDAVL
jgi:hypothetical protein